MGIRNKIWLFVLFSMLFLFMGFSNSSQAQMSQVKLDPKSIPWSQLTYSIKNFSADVNVQVWLDSLSPTEVEAVLIKSPQGVPVKGCSQDTNKITVHYMVDSILRPPVKTINQVWFNPTDATALGRTRLRRGNDDFKKVYRFTDQGVYRQQHEPRDKQESLKQPEKWTIIKDSFYPYDRDQLGCHKITERLVLIYIASAAKLSKNMRPLSFCVFGRRQLFHVQLKPQGIHSLKFDFMEHKQGDKIRRRGKVDALKIALETQPLASDLKKVEDFSFLGFQENIAIFFDPSSNLPIQLSGHIPMVGQVTIKLHEVQSR